MHYPYASQVHILPSGKIWHQRTSGQSTNISVIGAELYEAHCVRTPSARRKPERRHGHLTLSARRKAIMQLPCCALRSWAAPAYSGHFESIQIVTGPSLISDTCMSAPKRPVATLRPSSCSSRNTNRSKRGREISGGAARLHDGRFPFFTEAKRVNWLTASTSPATSSTLRFITP